MKQIRVAANYITSTNTPDWLPFGDWAHLQIVIVEGASQGELEVQMPVGEFINQAPNFGYRGTLADHTDIDHTANYSAQVNEEYNYTDVMAGDLIGRDEDDVAVLLVTIHEYFRSNSFNYAYLPGQNSNSYVNTLLLMVGLDNPSLISDSIPSAATGGAIGSDLNILTHGEKYSITNLGYFEHFPVDIILEATNGDDVLRTGTGNDQLKGGGSTTEPRILTFLSDDGNEQCYGFGTSEVCRNSPPSTLQYSTISTRNAASSAETSSRRTEPPLSPSGGNSVPHMFTHSGAN